MKKRFLVLAMALCMVFAFGFAFADETTETPEVMDHADCGVEGTDWEAVMDEEDYVPATCEADGMIRKHCSVCGVYVEETVLPKLGGHDVQVDAAVEPTCTETGLTEGKSCHNLITLADGTQVKCDYVEVAQEVIPAKGHGEAEPVDPNWRPENYDCEAGFSTPAQCSICKEELKIEIFVTFEHEPEVMEAVAETCTTTGLTEGSKCANCGKILVPQEEIAALGHDWQPVVGTAGSCTEDAVSYHHKCARCGEVDDDYVLLPAPGHKTVVVPGYAETCTKDGLSDGEKCTVCGEWIVEQTVIPAHNHKNDTAWETVLGTPATCTEAGIAAHRQCTICGMVQFDGKEFEGQAAIDAVTIPAHGHVDEAGWENKPAVGKPAQARPAQPELLVETNPELNKDATCTETGYKSAWHCPWCEAERIPAEVIPALGHDWEITKTGVVPTCTEWGISDEWTCNNCGTVTGNEDIKPRGHDMEPVAAKAATCTSDGNLEYEYCKRVGCDHAVITDESVESIEIKVVKTANNEVLAHPTEAVIVAYNHGFAPGVTEYESGVSKYAQDIAPVAPTCYSTGLGEGGLFCTLCNKVIKEAPALDYLPHNFVIVDAVANTCIKDGNLKFKYCSNEGCTLGYILDENDVEGMKLTVNKGEDNTLEVSEYPADVVLEKLGHDPKPGTGKAPTCTEPGWTNGLYCGRCGITLEEQAEIPETGHTPEVIPAVAPTCTETGLTEGEKCSVCGEILKAQEIVPATGHIYDDYVAAVAPGCVTDGHTEGLRCSICKPDYTLGDEKNKAWLIFPQVIDALGHDWHYEENLNVEPTCTAGGYDDYNYCDRCGLEVGEILPKTEHDWIKFDEQKPTCTEYGVISARTCRDCGYTAPQEEVAPLGHKPVEIPAVAATCTEDGLTAGEKCERCGLILKAQEVIPATGHNMVHVDAKEPTCAEDGNKEGQKCANPGCDHKIGCEVITKLNHTPTGVWVVEVKPTYGPEGQGLEVMYCKVCGQKIDARLIPALVAGLKGDANNDGAVNVIDVLVILQYDAGIISEIHFENADMNGDGKVNSIDALQLLPNV